MLGESASTDLQREIEKNFGDFIKNITEMQKYSQIFKADFGAWGGNTVSTASFTDRGLFEK